MPDVFPHTEDAPGKGGCGFCVRYMRREEINDDNGISPDSQVLGVRGRE